MFLLFFPPLLFLTFPSPSLPLEVGPPKPAGGKFFQRGPGRAPAENEFGEVYSCQKATDGNHFEYSEVHVLQQID